MTSDLKISLLQWDLAWHQPQSNFNKVEELMGNHPGSDLYLLPEMFTTGFTMEADVVAESMSGPTVTKLLEIAKNTNAWIIGSIVIREKNKFFNRMIACSPNGEITYYDKRHLFSFAGEDRFYSPGTQQVSIVINGWKLRLLVCYDLRFPVWSRNTDETDLIVYVANWPAARSHAWKSLLTARAIENQCYVAGVNRIGKDNNNIHYSGDTLMLDFNGSPIFDLQDNEAIGTAELSYLEQLKFREKFPFLKDRDSFEIKLFLDQ